MSYDRVAVYCFYDREGNVGRDVFCLLEDLKRNIDFLIIVVNGKLNNENVFQGLADEVVIRGNSGFDAGAYKRIIFDEKYASIIRNAEELVLCNSSFFGPFIPFSEIFGKMEKNDADFWGISSYERGIIEHLQSYFLVYRKKVLRGDVFFAFFEEYIQEETTDYTEVCAVFENGLFRRLVEAGYGYDAYVKGITCHNYKNPYGSLAIDGLPLVKKKIFSREYFSEKNALDALSYLSQNYEYDVRLILEGAEQIYHISMELESVTSHKPGAVSADWKEGIRKEKREAIGKFVEENKRIFIYGAGVAARSLYMTFFSYKNRPRLEGFVISDDQTVKEKSLSGYPVYKFHEVKDIHEAAVIVGLEKENSRKVRSSLSGIERLIYLWDD